MAYNTAEPRAEYSANAGQTEFDFVFKIFLTSDLKVYLTPFGQISNDDMDILTENVDYTISINGDNGGTVSLTNPTSEDDIIVLVRDLPIKRDYDYQQGGDLSSDNLNDDQNYQTYLIGDKQSDGNRFLKLSNTAIVDTNLLPPIIPHAYLKWDADGTGIEYDTSIPDGTMSQISRWASEAARLTAESYAIEPEDVFVKVYTSNGDGTFTITNTTDYSALHWKMKAQESIENLTLNTIEDLATYDGTGLVMVKDINRGGAFISKTVFEIDPNTGDLYIANGGTVFAKLGGGFWARQYSGAVNVKWYGAKGDGITDDTISIQNAINTIAFAKSGLIDLDSNKIYNINTHLTFFNKAIIFDGNNSTINLTVNADYILDVESNSCIFKNIVLSKNTGVVASGIRLKGLRFILNNIKTFNSKFTNVFYLDECKESFFSNIRVDNDVSGLTGKIFYLHGAVNNTLSDSMIGFCDNAVYSDTYLSSEGFTVSNLITVFCNKAFKMDKITSLNITNSVLDFCTACAIELSNGVFATINNTWCALIEGSTSSMFSFGAGFSNIKVYNNFLVGNGASITAIAMSSNAFDCDFSHNTLYNLNFGILNGTSCIHSFNKQFTGTANAGDAKGLFFNDGILTINSIDSTNTTHSIGRFIEFTQNMQGSGSNLVYSSLGDVPTFGEIDISENGTNNYLRLSFYKRGQTYAPVVTTIASNGLSFAGTNANGSIAITGYTNLANCVFSTKYRTNR